MNIHIFRCFVRELLLTAILKQSKLAHETTVNDKKTSIPFLCKEKREKRNLDARSVRNEAAIKLINCIGDARL